ncbi:DUF459 domain-containing protein [Campylobacter sp. 2018MI35]|uniref:SGNH/GDSL hydrolase family protein n=1 Tax=Campylobacter sp. 2018MI34 TaxID=2800582 RepID=UPI001905F18E|nr:DUF459 domain-containing protein [Campylobacter sp. 2018MI34]MBK1992061.1 DUF459 domain-containing protein [Campylobacter sp. 2018MI34]
MNILKFLFVLFCSFFLVVLVMNESISSYLEQKYHFIFYPQNTILKEANSLKVKLEEIKNIIINQQNTSKEDLDTDNNILEDNNSKELNTSNYLEQIKTNIIQETNTTNNLKSITYINPKDSFLFIGDSLMQGVAVALNKDLKNLGIKTMNLSKQNTGLSYKSYFNWANTTQTTLQKNPNIKYLVILLGVNDPWDIKKNGIYHHFNSLSWLQIYTHRVQELINIAKKYNVKIFWYEIPPVKKEDLNKKIIILNNIYENIVTNNNEIFIPTKTFFSYENKFSTYIINENNKSVKMRTDDGIHFTPTGAKKMSELLMQYIKIKDKND